MIKNKRFRNKQVFVIIILFIGTGIVPGVISLTVNEESIQSKVHTFEFFQEFSSPIIEEDGEYVHVVIEGINSFIIIQGGSKLPIFSKTLEFSWGTKIIDIECFYSQLA